MLLDVFKHYYRQVYSSEYIINEEANKKLIEGFYKRLNKHGYHRTSVGTEFLNRYFLFQIDYWRDKEIKRKPTLNWFIGKKAIDRFFSVENIEQKTFWVNQNTLDLQLYINPDRVDYESNIKRKSTGLIFCLENTSLYSKCTPCLICKVKEDCKKLLKENYPLLWRKRFRNV